ncbi:hypothetical protein [Dyadobacter sp. OTU695]|uniref:hypothetical protein n=1 Tax=Dyadobacter sp. OTU695 TaxID=3043860 RepID=UPI00313E929F
MAARLKQGDVFLISNGDFVTANGFNVEIGHLYDKPVKHDKTREKLRAAIIDQLYKYGVRFDYDLIIKFINHIAPDVPPSMTLIEQGHFIVTEIKGLGETVNERVYCKRFHPEPGQRADEFHFLQNAHGAGNYKYNVLMTLGPDEYS